MTTVIEDPELAATMAKGLRLVTAKQPNAAELAASNHPDVLEANRAATLATEAARVACLVANRATATAEAANKLAADMRKAARAVYGRELRRPSTPAEVAAQEGPLVEALKKSTERNDTKETDDAHG